MGKPSPPQPPDYAAAATAQGAANVTSAEATNYLNQVNQVGPNGSLVYSSDPTKTHTLSDGTVIPQTTATTILSPDQQKLYDQNMGLSQSLNDIAKQGIGYVGDTVNKPIDLNSLPHAGVAPSLSDFNSARDSVTNDLMSRLNPQISNDREQLDSKLANQGIAQGSAAYNDAHRLQEQGVTDQRTQAEIAGTNQANTMYNQGLAGAQFSDQARAQALQEQDYARNAPLNMLNALRTGNQSTIPQFGSAPGTGANIAAAPIYAATSDAGNFAQKSYENQMAAYGGLLGGLGSLGSAGITALSDRRLKQNIREVGKLASGLMVYSYNYLWSKLPRIGVMADEAELLFPDSVGYLPSGFAYVDYSRIG